LKHLLNGRVQVPDTYLILLLYFLTLTMKKRAPPPPKDPWAWIEEKCSGEKAIRPRRKAAKHMYAEDIKDSLAHKTNQVMESTPRAKRVELVWQRLLGLEWNALPDEEKQIYQMMCDADYEKDLKEYTAIQAKKFRRRVNEDPEHMQRFVSCAMSSMG
jgi:hypothetical protein